MQELTSFKREVSNDDLNTTATSITMPEFKRHFGNNFTFFYLKGEPLITIGPHWPLTICMLATFAGASYLFLFQIAILKGNTIFYLSCAVAFLQLASYIITALKNPGIVTSSREYKGLLCCAICNNPKQLGPLYHCEDCDVCISGFDHHCPWTGKCIGKGNIRPFYIFVTMVPLYIMYFIVICLL